MSLIAVPLSGEVLTSPAELALADVARAVSEASRARNSARARAVSTLPPAVDFTALDLLGWKCYAKLSLFKGKDGMVRFKDGKATTTRRPSGESGTNIEVKCTTRGGHMSVEASALIDASDA
eukprot:2083023-Pleurochrysis_carterae.AAC.1